MKIVFIGTVLFSEKILSKLIELKANIVGVITKEESDFNSDFVDLSEIATKNELPFKYVDNINKEENINWIKEKTPDIIFCFGWSQLLKKEVLNTPKMGVVGFHPAKLPMNRGRHLLIWTLALGLEVSTSTFFFMSEGADDGDILSQSEVDVSSSDDAYSLYNKIVRTGVEQVEKVYPELCNGTYKREKQNHSLANYWRKRNKNDGLIDFRMNASTIYNQVRALTRSYVGTRIFSLVNRIVIPILYKRYKI